MIVLLILLGLLLLIFLLLCVPVRFDFTYTGQVNLRVKYLFLRFQVIPAPEKPQKSEKKQPAEKKTSDTPKEKKPNPLFAQAKKYKEAEGLSGLLLLAKDLLKATGTRAEKLIRHVRLKTFDLYVLVGGEDAAQTAILYGEVCAGVYPAVALLLSLTGCKPPHGRVSVDLDYNEKEPKISCTACGALRPVFVLHHGVQYLLRTLLPFYQKFQNAGKPAAKQSSSGEHKKERTT